MLLMLLMLMLLMMPLPSLDVGEFEAYPPEALLPLNVAWIGAVPAVAADDVDVDVDDEVVVVVVAVAIVVVGGVAGGGWSKVLLLGTLT
jgi:hypothetical protein